MKIAFIAGQLGQGGAERQLYYYIKTLKQNGSEPYVLCITRGQFWESKFRELGVSVIWVGKSTNKLIRLFAIVKEISKRPTDVIHSQHFPMNLYGFMAGLVLGISSIGSLRSNVYDEIADAGYLGKFSFRLPKLLVCNSENGIKNAQILGKTEGQLFYLPNVVDENHFTPSLASTYNQKLKVVFVGTIWPPKRVDRILRVAKICLDTNINVDFYIYGEGEQLDQLKRISTNLGVQDKNLHFMGRISDPLAAYQQSDVFLLTSDREGTPNVLLEAMACGLPIVSTDIGDVSAYIKSGHNGFIIESPNEEQKIVVSLEMLSNNRLLSKEMGSINRKIIEEKASLKTLGRLLTELYLPYESTK